MSALQAWTAFGVLWLVLGAAAALVVCCSGIRARRTRTRHDDDLAVARAAGVVPGEEDPDMTAEERAAEAAYLDAKYAASPDVDWRDCPVIPGRDGGEGGNNP